MEIYLSIFFLGTLCFVLERTDIQRNTRIFIDIILLAFLAIMVSTSNQFHISDMRIYQNVYKIIPKVGEFNFATVHQIYGTFEMEKGFLFLMSLLKTINISFRGFYVIHTLFVLGALYYGIHKYTPDFAIVIILFFYKLFFYNLFISMRQSISIAIFWIIIHYIEEKKIIPYMLGCFIAITMHVSAMILIPVYFIRYLKVSRGRLIIYISSMTIGTIIFSGNRVVGFILQFIRNPTVYRKLSGYLQAGGSLGIFHSLEYLIIIFLVILFYNKIIKDDPHEQIIISMLVALAPIFTVFRDFGVITRFKDYFTIFYGVIFGLCYKLNRRNRLLIYSFGIGLSLFGYVRFILLFDGGTSLLPYRNTVLKLIGEAI